MRARMQTQPHPSQFPSLRETGVGVNFKTGVVTAAGGWIVLACGAMKARLSLLVLASFRFGMCRPGAENRAFTYALHAKHNQAGQKERQKSLRVECRTSCPLHRRGRRS